LQRRLLTADTPRKDKPVVRKLRMLSLLLYPAVAMQAFPERDPAIDVRLDVGLSGAHLTIVGYHVSAVPMLPALVRRTVHCNSGDAEAQTLGRSWTWHADCSNLVSRNVITASTAVQLHTFVAELQESSAPVRVNVRVLSPTLRFFVTPGWNQRKSIGLASQRLNWEPDDGPLPPLMFDAIVGYRPADLIAAATLLLAMILLPGLISLAVIRMSRVAHTSSWAHFWKGWIANGTWLFWISMEPAA